MSNQAKIRDKKNRINISLQTYFKESLSNRILVFVPLLFIYIASVISQTGILSINLFISSADNELNISPWSIWFLSVVISFIVVVLLALMNSDKVTVMNIPKIPFVELIEGLLDVARSISGVDELLKFSALLTNRILLYLSIFVFITLSTLPVISILTSQLFLVFLPCYLFLNPRKESKRNLFGLAALVGALETVSLFFSHNNPSIFFVLLGAISVVIFCVLLHSFGRKQNEYKSRPLYNFGKASSLRIFSYQSNVLFYYTVVSLSLVFISFCLPRIFGTISSIIIFFIPLLFTLYAFFKNIRLAVDYLDQLARTGIRDVITPYYSSYYDSFPNDAAISNNEVREGDGYYRTCVPCYYSDGLQLDGEFGYCAWPEASNLSKIFFPREIRQWLIYRNITSNADKQLVKHDSLGNIWRNSILGFIRENLNDLFPDDKKSSSKKNTTELRLKSVFDSLETPWVMKIYESDTEDYRYYLKAPWESGEVIAIPVRAQLCFIFPLCLGILDKDGIPCESEPVNVNVSFKKQFLDMLGKQNRNADENIIIDNFIKSVPLLIPTLYENCLRLIIDEAKKDSFIFHNDGDDGNFKSISIDNTLSNDTNVKRILTDRFSELLDVRFNGCVISQGIVSREEYTLLRQTYAHASTLSTNLIDLLRKRLSYLRDPEFFNGIRQCLLHESRGNADPLYEHITKILDNYIEGGDVAARFIVVQGGQVDRQPGVIRVGGGIANRFSLIDEFTKSLKEFREEVRSLEQRMEKSVTDIISEL